MKPLRTILLLCFLCVTAALSAQETLNGAQVFDGRFRSADYATETSIQGSQLKPYNLTLFRSLTVTGQPAVAQTLSDLVSADSQHAVNKEEKIRGNRINYGLYEFKPVQKGKPGRFLFFFSNNRKAVLIYMEGNTNLDNIKHLIKK